MKSFDEKNNKLFNESKIKQVFLRILKENDIDTELFEKNCETINVIKRKKFKHGEDAMYDIFDNNLLVKDNHYVDVIWHEILHMSSSVRCGNIAYSGVSYVLLNNTRVGYGLNEGVTVLIDFMFFKGITKKHDIKSDTYEIEKILCGMLYDVLGSFLLKCYFNADFYGLYNYLISLNGVKKTDRFYEAFDALCYEGYYSNNSDKIKNEKIFNAYKYAYYYLVELLIKKLHFNYENGIIEESVYKDALSKADTVFSDVFFISKTGEKFEISKEKIRELIKKNISNI